ncbi:MAG: hypothetical protein AABW49_02985 [Nanoarchaeota archaeon]
MSKDLGEQLPYWVVRIAVSILVLGLLIFYLGLHITRDVDVRQVESELLMNRVFYSSKCFAAEDVRTYPGEVDVNKMTSEQLNKCLDGPVYIKAKLIGHDIAVFNDEEMYEQLKGFCKFKKYNCQEKLVPVRVRNGVLEEDVLLLHLILEDQSDK